MTNIWNNYGPIAWATYPEDQFDAYYNASLDLTNGFGKPCFGLTIHIGHFEIRLGWW